MKKKAKGGDGEIKISATYPQPLGRAKNKREVISIRRDNFTDKTVNSLCVIKGMIHKKNLLNDLGE